MSIRDRLPHPDNWWLWLYAAAAAVILAIYIILAAVNHDNNTPTQDNNDKTMICMWTYVGKVPVCNPIYL